MMKKIIGTVFVFAVAAVSAFSQISDSVDKQLWADGSVEFSILKNRSEKEKINGVFSGSVHFGDNINSVSETKLVFGLKFKPSKNLTITPSYVFKTQPSFEPRRYEHRLRFDVTPKKTWNSFSIDNRSRLEHRFKTNGRDDDTFFRNRTKLQIPIRDNGETLLTPFVSNESYFDIQNPRGIYRNDTRVGVSRGVDRKLTVDVFYQFRKNFRSATGRVHIIGMNFKFKVNNKGFTR